MDGRQRSRVEEYHQRIVLKVNGPTILPSHLPSEIVLRRRGRDATPARPATGANVRLPVK
jgi:hypothetical protein